MVLSKMNNHEHRTKQTYESYTFQTLMSFWFYCNGGVLSQTSPAKTSVSPRSSPLGTFRQEENAKRTQRRRARSSGCFRRLSQTRRTRHFARSAKRVGSGECAKFRKRSGAMRTIWISNRNFRFSYVHALENCLIKKESVLIEVIKSEVRISFFVIAVELQKNVRKFSFSFAK